MQTPQFIYRTPNPDDIPQLMKVGLAAYGQYHRFMSAEDALKMDTNMGKPEMWAALLEKSAGFICEVDGVIVGMAFLTPSGNPWEMFPADWSYIRLVGVLPGYQGQGIATKLMAQCVEHARATGEQTIALHTSEHMHAARHIYEKMGFTILKEIPPRLGMKYWIYSMNV